MSKPTTNGNKVADIYSFAITSDFNALTEYCRNLMSESLSDNSDNFLLETLKILKGAKQGPLINLLLDKMDSPGEQYLAFQEIQKGGSAAASSEASGGAAAPVPPARPAVGARIAFGGVPTAQELDAAQRHGFGWAYRGDRPGDLTGPVMGLIPDPKEAQRPRPAPAGASAAAASKTPGPQGQNH